jgi:GT2 family glycosyltransferase
VNLSGVELSILIVSFNTRDLTRACLRSVYENTHGIEFEVIVVDNVSSDGSADAVAKEFSQARLVRARENLGFAGANNLAAKMAVGEYLLLLNPDTVVLDRAIETLYAFCKQRRPPAICGGRTLRGDGSLDPTSCWKRPTVWSMCCAALGLAKLFPRSGLFNSEGYGGWKRDSVRTVDIITGCFLMIGRSLWNSLDGFDSAFFMYGEEADLCLRAKKLGIGCVVCPDAEIIHYGGASERVLADKVVRLFTAKGLLFSRHWRGKWPLFGIAMLDVWAATRVLGWLLLSCVRSNFSGNYRTWREIWRQRTAWRRTFLKTGSSLRAQRDG